MINTICVKIQQRQRRGKGNKITRDTGRKKEPIGERGVGGVYLYRDRTRRIFLQGNFPLQMI